jgi:hypothetical protein
MAIQKARKALVIFVREGVDTKDLQEMIFVWLMTADE